MEDKTQDISQKESKAKNLNDFNAETISSMGYSEIIKANRNSHAGTFMDRSWRDPSRDIEVLNDPTLSRWQKLTQGGYSYQSISGNWINKFEQNQVKLKFVEDLIERKA